MAIDNDPSGRALPGGDLARVEAIALQAAADAALGIELVGQFFGGQIDAGAVLREEIALHIRVCAERVGEREPAFADRVMLEAHEMIARLPSGWRDGDVADEGDNPHWEPA